MAQLDDQARHHLGHVLRYRIGNPVTYTDGGGRFGEGTYEGDVIARGAEQRMARQPSVTVAVAPPHRTSRIRFLVEKAAEIGVDRLVWLETAHGQGRPPRADKAASWARAALEQSRGAWLTDIGEQVAIEDIQTLGSPVFADVSGGKISELGDFQDPVLCIGPEGGFAPGEIPEDAICVSLGNTILRVETAAVVGAVLLQNRC